MIFGESDKFTRFRKATACGFVVYLSLISVSCETIPDNSPKTNVQVAERQVIGKITDVDEELHFAIVEFHRSMLPPKKLSVKNENYETVSVLNLSQEITKRVNTVAYDIQEGIPLPNDRIVDNTEN